ncbi:MAG: hypothetical protein V1661_00610 [bacterium]
MSSDEGLNEGFIKKMINVWYFLRKYAYSPKYAIFAYPIILSLFCIFIIIITLQEFDKIFNHNISNYIKKDYYLYIFLAFLFYFLIRLLRYPRCKKHGIAIGLSLHELKPKHISDALHNIKMIKMELQKIINNHELNKHFEVCLLNDYHASNLHRFWNEKNKNILSKLEKKTKIKFFIFGTMKREYYNDKEKYKFNLNYGVSHQIVPEKISLHWSKDFTEALQEQRWIFDVLDEGTMQEKSAENIEENAVLSCAITSIGYKNDFSINLLRYLYNKKIARKGINSKIIKYLSLGHLFNAIALYNNNNFREAIQSLNEGLIYKNDDYNAYLLLGKLHFENKNIIDALSAIEKAGIYQQDSSWLFSKAFLYFYKDTNEDILLGLEIYKKLTNNKLNKISITQFIHIKNHIIETLEKEPMKIQYYYSLVFLYVKALNEYTEARKYYDELLKNKNNRSIYNVLVKEAQKLLNF